MATAAPVQPDAPHQGLLARHPLISFFIIAYAGSWLVTVPVALSANGLGRLPFGIPNGSVIFVSAVWVFLGPTLAAFIMTGLTEGRAGIGRLLRRYVLWRVGLRWYLIVLLAPPCDHIARHDRAAGGSGIVSDARSPLPAALAR
jgi:uncharacterized protein